jgi:hypothetical protein
MDVFNTNKTENYAKKEQGKENNHYFCRRNEKYTTFTFIFGSTVVGRPQGAEHW